MSRTFEAVVSAAAVIVLTGCGTASSTPRVEPDIAGTPTWGGCQEHSIRNIDYVSDARGAKTREAAMKPYRAAGDHVVHQPRRPHRNAQVLLVDDHDVIHHALEMWNSGNGWLVNMVESCAD